MMIRMPSDNLTDYSAVIRAQIEKDVARLRFRMERNGQQHHPDGSWSEDDVVAQYVEIGYLINLHHGQALFKEGDMVAGLPISLDGTHPRTIRVCADGVCFVRDVEGYDAEGEPQVVQQTHRKDLYEETTW